MFYPFKIHKVYLDYFSGPIKDQEDAKMLHFLEPTFDKIVDRYPPIALYQNTNLLRRGGDCFI